MARGVDWGQAVKMPKRVLIAYSWRIRMEKIQAKYNIPTILIGRDKAVSV